MRRACGFTLVELLVAMFITAILFAMGYGAINQAIGNRESLQRQQERLAAVQRAMRLLVQDLAQAQPRPVRDAVGGGFEPAFAGNPATGGAAMTLTRGGWANPAGVQRASLQRVSWLLVDGRLRRESRPALDAVASAPSRGRTLIDGVRAVRLRFMDVTGSWRETWPPPSAAPVPEKDRRLLPLGVEVTLELEDWGTLTRIIEVAN